MISTSSSTPTASQTLMDLFLSNLCDSHFSNSLCALYASVCAGAYITVAIFTYYSVS